jgi:hypothetical protein
MMKGWPRKVLTSTADRADRHGERIDGPMIGLRYSAPGALTASRPGEVKTIRPGEFLLVVRVAHAAVRLRLR